MFTIKINDITEKRKRDFDNRYDNLCPVKLIELFFQQYYVYSIA